MRKIRRRIEKKGIVVVTDDDVLEEVWADHLEWERARRDTFEWVPVIFGDGFVLRRRKEKPE